MSRIGLLNYSQWYFRAGTALAVLSKLFFAAAIGIAFMQAAWRTTRFKVFTLQNIDSLFGAASDPFVIFNREILIHATIPLLLTILLWYVIGPVGLLQSYEVSN
jgi:hypothetical protein